MAINAQGWVSFGSRAEGTPPEISVNRSDNQQVSFTVNLSGMYVESKNETSGVYKRLSLPECGVTGEVGSPEIPVVTKMLAIPECSEILYTVTLSGKQTFANYTVYPVPAYEAHTNNDGNVQWKRINNPQQIDNITADYLIICANAFFSGNQPHDEVKRIANHRAQYNGFDIMILNVEDIISDGMGFFYEGQLKIPIDTTYKKEQRIRTCIRTIYETGTARNTLDGKLGYVLLIGEVGTENSGMPSSYDHGVSSNPEMTSDYYFSCITKGSNGIYDRFGDLFIGRFCVPNNLNTGDNGGLTRLHNIIEKTIYFETEYHNQPWKKHVVFANDERSATSVNQVSGQIVLFPTAAMSLLRIASLIFKIAIF
ncbi:MAG: C25 family cysteine peptidase [Bacteroidetes bacterium]|nr:C25 family cysteine peptidase [Bacteroidota bacterium]MCL2302745.1 C25 family cysteine peptidase [Lentimicrobiaceae bacterium]